MIALDLSQKDHPKGSEGIALSEQSESIYWKIARQYFKSRNT